MIRGTAACRDNHQVAEQPAPADPADVIWNRAALDAGGPCPRHGDAALSAVLGLHGLAMSGGLLDAVERGQTPNSTPQNADTPGLAIRTPPASSPSSGTRSEPASSGTLTALTSSSARPTSGTRTSSPPTPRYAAPSAAG
jgi:hypothetical protein